MRFLIQSFLLAAALGGLSLTSSAQEAAKTIVPATASQPAASKATPSIVETLQAEAAALRSLVTSDLARHFLDATAALPLPEPRTILRTKDRGAAYTPEQAARLPEEKRATLVEKTYDARFYYTTGYGSPLVYARVVDLLAQHGVTSLVGKRLMDFGYGTVGHIRLLASLQCDAHGVDVEPVFGALYARPEDQGQLPPSDHGPLGRITLHCGRWPAERSIVRDVGTGYDIITSKNTLKRGYIHPSRRADPRTFVRLGVDDGTFLRNVHDALNFGGLFIIYNICPAQAPPDKPCIPWADGQCPFSREMLERSGFEVVEFDREDREIALDYWVALGISPGKSREETGADLFAWYTICRKSKRSGSPPNR